MASTTLQNARYLSLATFRKNGDVVATPVWFAERNGTYYVFSEGDAGKVKRLRNSSRARVAPCDMRGKLLGEWTDAQAFVVEGRPERDAAFRALREKYGWQMGLLDFFSRLGGKIDKRAVIRIQAGKSAKKKR
jgi:PPOX class probable F420-dependent enzyme